MASLQSLEHLEQQQQLEETYWQTRDPAGGLAVLLSHSALVQGLAMFVVFKVSVQITKALVRLIIKTYLTTGKLIEQT